MTAELPPPIACPSGSTGTSHLRPLTPRPHASCSAFLLRMRVGVGIGSGSAWLLKGCPPPSHSQPRQALPAAVWGPRDKDEKEAGPRIGGGRRRLPAGLQSQTGGPFSPQEGLRTLGGRNTQPPAEGPQVQTERRRQTHSSLSPKGSPRLGGDRRTDIGEIRWQGSDTHRQPQTARGGCTQQGWGPRLIPASEGHSQTQAGGPRQTARAGSLYPPRQTKGDSQTPGSVRTAPPP